MTRGSIATLLFLWAPTLAACGGRTAPAMPTPTPNLHPTEGEAGINFRRGEDFGSGQSVLAATLHRSSQDRAVASGPTTYLLNES